jgi:hypothetical protein
MPLAVIVPIVVVGACAAIHVLLQKRYANANLPAGANLTVEQRMANLENLGIRILPPYTLQDVLDYHPYSLKGYAGLLHILGFPDYNEDTDEETPRCNALYTFDMECIGTNPGDYTSKIEAISRLAAGDLVITDAKDSYHFAIPDQVPFSVEIDFLCNGKPVHWEFVNDNDWFDPRVIEWLGDLLQASGSQRALFALAGDGQCAEVGCLLIPQVRQLEKLVGMKLL